MVVAARVRIECNKRNVIDAPFDAKDASRFTRSSESIIDESELADSQPSIFGTVSKG